MQLTILCYFFLCGFHGCFNDFHRAFIATVKHMDEIFYFGISGQLLNVVIDFMAAKDDFFVLFPANFLSIVISSPYLRSYTISLCKSEVKTFGSDLPISDGKLYCSKEKLKETVKGIYHLHAPQSSKQNSSQIPCESESCFI